MHLPPRRTGSTGPALKQLAGFFRSPFTAEGPGWGEHENTGGKDLESQAGVYPSTLSGLRKGDQQQTEPPDDDPKLIVVPPGSVGRGWLENAPQHVPHVPRAPQHASHAPHAPQQAPHAPLIFRVFRIGQIEMQPLFTKEKVFFSQTQRNVCVLYDLSNLAPANKT